MKKKFIVLGLVVLAMMAMLVPGAFAAGTNTGTTQAQTQGYYTQQAQDYYNQMFEWRKAQVDQALANGYITAEQAKAWKQQIDSMKDFQQKNGFGPMMGGGMYGYCW